MQPSVIPHVIRQLFRSFWAKAQLIAAVASSALLLVSAGPAKAVDGCVVLLCLAAPSWRAIAQCVPPVTQLFRDLARGRAFPRCQTAGTGNSTVHEWAQAPGNCPPQYMHVFDTEAGPVYTCDYAGVVSVAIEGSLFSQTWWSWSGSTSTEFTAAAKARLGSWDTKFDDDYMAWRASQASATASLPSR